MATAIRTALSAIVIAVSALVAVGTATAAQYAAVTTWASPPSTSGGGSAKLIIHIALNGPKYHINANKPADKYAYPTTFTATPTTGVTFGAPLYPKDEKVAESYATAPLLVYKGTPTIIVPIKVAKTAKRGAIKISGLLKFQGCDDKACYPPMTQTVTATLTIK